MLRYGDISDGKMKFIQTIIENFEYFKKNFYTEVRLIEIFWHNLIVLTKTETGPPPSEGGFSTISWSRPPLQGGRFPLESMTLYQNMQNIFKNSLSVMLKNSKIENFKYYGPNQIQY